MGCGSSKDADARGPPTRRYLTYDDGGVYLPDTGPLTAREYKERLVTSGGTRVVELPGSGYAIRYAYVSQRGYYPDSPDKPNQDAFCAHVCFGGDPEQHLLGVFDGHGEFGSQAAQFARDRVPGNLLASGHFAGNPALAMHNAMVAANMQCHQADFDDSMSGTTAVCLLVRGRQLLVANVGDSRAVLAERCGDGRFEARDLSLDQTPYRPDECERVKAAGARVLTLDQVEGLKDPHVECWTTEEEDDGDPPRLWFPNAMYPGTAFTRSIGDAAAERIGVFAEPEIEAVALSPAAAFVVLASDGVFEFLSSQSVVDMVSKFDDLHDAALSVVAESYRLWLQYETRTDDITMMVAQFVGLGDNNAQGGVAAGGAGAKGGADGFGIAPLGSMTHAPVLSELGLQPATARVASQHSLPPPPVLLPDIDPPAHQANGAGAGGAGGEAGAGDDASLHLTASSDLLALLALDARSAPSGSQLGATCTSAASAAAASAAAGALKIGGGGAGAELARGVTSAGTVISNEKSAAVTRMLEESVKNNFLFSHLTQPQRSAVFAEMERVEVQPGEVVIRQGDRGDHFFVAERGEYDVLVAPPLESGGGGQQQQQQQQQPDQQQQQQEQEEDEWRVIDQGELVHTYRAPAEVGAAGSSPHPSFGELALLYGKPRAATVVAVTDGVLWRISREAFRRALRGSDAGADPMALVVRALRSMELLAPLSAPQLRRLAEELRIEHFNDGDYICRQGGAWDAFHVVAKGTVVALAAAKEGGDSAAATTASSGADAAQQQQQQQQQREVLTMGPGQYFGERHLLGATVRPASMVARGDVTVLTMSRGAFEALFGPLPDLLASYTSWRASCDGQRDLLRRSPLLGPQPDKVLSGRVDARKLSVRGALWRMGAYEALVEVAEPQGGRKSTDSGGNGGGGGGGGASSAPPTGLSLTARVIAAADVEARGLGAAVARSRAITRVLPPNVLVPHVVASWADSKGGAYAAEALATRGVCTLRALVEDGPLDDASAAYAGACVLCALQHLHFVGVLFRGLSADTVLVTETGLLQLVDFRFARRNDGRAFTLCGPPQYLAPEVVEGTGHHEAADFWALGVLLFHLLTGGAMPFALPGDDELRVYRRIARASPSYPPSLSAEARDLVSSLLVRDPAARLGVAPGGMPRLMAHPFFSKQRVDWERVRTGSCPLPPLLRDRLLAGAAGGLSAWQPPPPVKGGGGKGKQQQQPPLWLREF